MVRGATRKASAAQPRDKAPIAWLQAVSLCSVGLLLLSGLGLGAWKLASIPVGRIAVVGELERVSQDALMVVINNSLSGGFLAVDLESVREPLEALPWVHRAVLRRRWPDSIEVKIIEQTPIARWGSSGLLNHSGEVFLVDNSPSLEGLPLLSGPDGRHREVMRQYRRVHEQLQAMGWQVKRLHMDQRGGLLATLQNGAELILGYGDVDNKLARLRVVLTHAEQSSGQQPQRIDLRYSHGLAIAWQNDKQQDS